MSHIQQKTITFNSYTSTKQNKENNFQCKKGLNKNMKRMNRFVCILFAGCVLMTGCGNASSTNTATENTVAVSDTESGKVDAKSDSTVTGMIESIEDNTITLSVMNPNGGGRPDGGAPDNAGNDSSTGEAADNNSNGAQSNSDASDASDNSNKPGGEAPDANGTGDKPGGGAPDANGTGDKPSGGAPDNNGGGMPGGESKTITVSTTAVITDEEGNTVSLSDLGKGTMVTIELDEDGNVISITIASKENSMGAPGQSQGAPESYTTVNEYTTDIELTGENIQSAGTDENAVLVSDGAEVSIGSVAVTSYGHKTACHGKQTVIKLHCIVIGLF